MTRTPMVTISARVLPEEADAAEEYARKAGMSLARWLQQAFQEKLEKEQA